MKFFRALFVFLLIIIIIGGIGYIGYSMYYGPNNNLASIFPRSGGQNNNMAGMTGQNTQGNMNMAGGNTTSPSTNDTNNTNLTSGAIALQNRQKLLNIQNMVNEAIDLITMDPYSRVTVPSSMSGSMQMPQTQSDTGTINIYPNGTNSVNVTPPAGTATTPPTAAAPATGATGMAGMNMQGGTTYVYDQAKLEQLHRGIIRLAQGIMYLTQLNEDLTVQASTMETNSYSYQTYMNRYNQALKNKTRLNSAIASINQASELVNVNPYGSNNGYPYNAQYMEQMHRGIYTLAQAMVMANDLNDDLTTQMARALIAAQNSIFNSNMSNMGNMSGMTPSNSWSNMLNPTSIAIVFNLLLIIMVVVLIISIFGAIGHMFKRTDNKYDKRSNTTNESKV